MHLSGLLCLVKLQGSKVLVRGVGTLSVSFLIYKECCDLLYARMLMCDEDGMQGKCV